MYWDLTYLAVHLMAAYAFAKLYQRAPCWMQRLSVLGWSLCMIIVAVAFCLKINRVDGYFYLIWGGLVVGHLATLLYAFRLIQKEFLCPPTGSKPSLS